MQSYPALERREPVAGGAGPAWRNDGRELYYVQNAAEDGPLKVRMMAVPMTTTPTLTIGMLKVLWRPNLILQASPAIKRGPDNPADTSPVP